MCYNSPVNRCEVRCAYDESLPGVQAELDVALNFLGALRRELWTNPRRFAAKLDKQKWPEFYEIRFKHKNVQYRPIGFFGPKADEFTFVIWCTEKGGHILPKTWFKTAKARMDEIKEGGATTLPLYDRDNNEDE